MCPSWFVPSHVRAAPQSAAERILSPPIGWRGCVECHAPGCVLPLMPCSHTPFRDTESSWCREKADHPFAVRSNGTYTPVNRCKDRREWGWCGCSGRFRRGDDVLSAETLIALVYRQGFLFKVDVRRRKRQ